MKLRFIYILLSVIFAFIILQSNSAGPAAAGNGDRTGSPISSGTCGSCHSGGSFGTTYSITLKDGVGNTVTSYTPGVVYFVECRVNSTSGTRYATQAVAIRNTNAQAGSFGTPTSTNTRITNFSGRQYIEHNGFATGAGGFTFRAPWTAPAAGTGNVRIYGMGMTVNGTGSTGGDHPSSSTMITITETPFATINYSSTNYCANGIDPLPNLTGTSGGSFSATPSGLSINASTGVIDVSASTPGQTYTITYTYGGGLTATDVLSITAADNAAFNYSAGSSFCKNGADPSPTVTGLVGGTFSSTSGLSINSSTGVIDVSASQAGNYTVTYTTNGTCPNTSSVPITIVTADIGQFTLGGNVFCQNGIDRTPVGSTPGATWTGSPGLVFAASNGVIDVSASTVGSHTLKCVTNGVCPDSSTFSFTIVAVDTASFSLSDTTFCQDGSDGLATILGTSGGTFSGTAGLSVNPTTGQIDVSASTPGNHLVTYTTNGTCVDAKSKNIVINPAGNAQFTYGNNTFCQNATNPTPTAGMSGGWWTGTAGLVIDSLTGGIVLAASTVGNHIVSHFIGAPCPDTTTMSITILAGDIAAFDFLDTTICLNVGTNPILAVTGTTSGTYSVTPSSGLVFVNNSTGEIDLANSAAGTYTLTYTSNGACPTTANVMVDLSICGGFADVEQEEHYKLYPNPNQGTVSIGNTASAGEIAVKIVDVLGKTVFVQNYFMSSNAVQLLDLSHLASGTYFVQLTKAGLSQTLKMDIR